jgi:hypothetical protein
VHPHKAIKHRLSQFLLLLFTPPTYLKNVPLLQLLKMSSQEGNEQNYWKAYCQIIKEKIAPQLGPHSALFFGTEAVRCVPV